MFLVFGHQACGILAPQLGIKPAPPALEGKVLTTGPAGKSLTSLLKFASLVHLQYQLSGVSFLENELRNGDLLAGGLQGVCSGVNHQGALGRV